jgi:predicted DNA-binding transcriptional regulator YafY
METTGHKELVRWILSWMPELKVLGPAEIKTKVVTGLKGGLQLLGNG